MSNQFTVPLTKIHGNKNALRKVNREKPEYLELVQSVSKTGILQPILVREIKDEDGNDAYGLVDGLHRYTAAHDAGLTEIPVIVKSLDDVNAMMAQIITNVSRFETQHSEYAKQLQRILALEPTLTPSELANRLGKSVAWLKARLSLSKLTADIQKLVDEDKIQLTNAYNLAKLPESEQVNFVDRAMTDKPETFLPVIATRIKELNEAKRQGRDAAVESEFVPHPTLRKMADLKSEAESREAARLLTQGLTTPQDGFTAGIKWALQMDPASVEMAKEREIARKKAVEDAKEQRRLEREKQRATEGAQKAAQLQEMASA